MAARPACQRDVIIAGPFKAEDVIKYAKKLLSIVNDD